MKKLEDVYKILSDVLKEYQVIFLKKIKGKECIAYNFVVENHKSHNNKIDSFKITFQLQVFIKDDVLVKLSNIIDKLKDNFFGIRVSETFICEDGFTETRILCQTFIE